MTNNNATETVSFVEALSLLEQLDKCTNTLFDNKRDAQSYYVGMLETIAASALSGRKVNVQNIKELISLNAA